MKRKLVNHILLLVLCAIVAKKGQGQLHTFEAGYFQNQYLLNPAMSGLENGKARISIGYSRQGNVSDAPVSMYGAADYGFAGNMGAGVNVFSDRAGLLTATKVMATYSYHIRLGAEDQRLHLGISAGGQQYRLNFQDVIGDLNDPTLYNYNTVNSMKFEMDAGLAYTDGKLNLQAAFPNLASYARKANGTVANRPTFFLAGSYKWKVGDDEEGVSVEPKAAFRGVTGNDNIFDAGVNVAFLKELFNVFGLYHTTKNVTAGVGVRILDFAQASVMYTTQSAAFSAYTRGDLEFGLQFWLK
jgi:type IX secretion system PorP/SprF family membrane protein